MLRPWAGKAKTREVPCHAQSSQQCTRLAVSLLINISWTLHREKKYTWEFSASESSQIHSRTNPRGDFRYSLYTNISAILITRIYIFTLEFVSQSRLMDRIKFAALPSRRKMLMFARWAKSVLAFLHPLWDSLLLPYDRKLTKFDYFFIAIHFQLD